ncbi:hypothetical protein ACFDTO_17465 [Microbacteriaceae bacterium 4G12]
MDSVRTAFGPCGRVLHRISCPPRHPCRGIAVRHRRLPLPGEETSVLDVTYVLATLALFAIVGLLAKGVERL